MSTIAPKAPNPSASSRSNGPRRICVAYSGGLDTSCVIPWLREHYKCEVVAFVADVGQGKDELIGIEKKAKDSGACECYVADLREKFLTDFVWPMVMAGCTYEGRYLLGTSIARPCIAEAHVKAALETNCDAVAHGCTGKGNDQVRFELGYYALEPNIRVIAPWREWKLGSRESLLKYAEKNGIPVEGKKKGGSPYSMDANLLHISFEGRVLEDPAKEPEADMWRWTVSPEAAPDQAEYVDLEYKQGDIVAINGKKLSPAKVLDTLNKLGGKHGIGRLDLVENRYVGMKSRGCYETPGGTIMLRAHRAIESVCLDREVAHLKDDLMPRYASLIYNGYWWSPERRMLQTMIDASQANVNGWVRVKLYKGNVVVVGRDSKTDSLFDTAIATFEEDRGAFDQMDAEGFIRLNALRMRIAANLRKRSKKS